MLMQKEKITLKKKTLNEKILKHNLSGLNVTISTWIKYSIKFPPIFNVW